MVIDKFLENDNFVFKNKFNGLYVEKKVDDEKVIFLKPQSYINLSGEVIKEYMNYFKIDISDVLIIHDDLDIELGKYKLKQNGGSGGHNGIKNITLNLEESNYSRLRIGISNNKSLDTKDYVLGKFNEEERKEIMTVVDITVNIINDYLKMNFLSLMNKYN